MGGDQQMPDPNLLKPASRRRRLPDPLNARRCIDGVRADVDTWHYRHGRVVPRNRCQGQRCWG